MEVNFKISDQIWYYFTCDTVPLCGIRVFLRTEHIYKVINQIAHGLNITGNALTTMTDIEWHFRI